MKMIKYLCLCFCVAVVLITNTIAYAQETPIETQEKKVVTLTFYTNENTVFETVSGENQVRVTEKIPVRENYKFLYWTYEKDGEKIPAQAGMIFEQDTNFYAVWEPQMAMPADMVKKMEDSKIREEQIRKIQLIQRRRPVVSVKKTKGNATTVFIDAAKYEKDGYEIQYSTSKKFKKVKTITVESTKKKLTKKVKNLKKGKTYYIRIRAYRVFDPAKYNIAGQKETFYSNWSKTAKVTVKK